MLGKTLEKHGKNSPEIKISLQSLNCKKDFEKIMSQIKGCVEFCKFCGKKCEEPEINAHAHHCSKFGHQLRVLKGGKVQIGKKKRGISDNL